MATKYWIWTYETPGDTSWASKSDGVHYDGWFDSHVLLDDGHPTVNATALPADGDVVVMPVVDGQMGYTQMGFYDGPAPA